MNIFIFRRGLSSFSLKANEEAIESGYKMVDADILFVKDNILIVSHIGNLKSISNGKDNLLKNFNRIRIIRF